MIWGIKCQKSGCYMWCFTSQLPTPLIRADGAGFSGANRSEHRGTVVSRGQLPAGVEES